ncbi:MAG: thioredoxin family protein [Clostridia bacterium]|nr:thioredoxin family protein [Clostridia bacterium]
MSAQNIDRQGFETLKSQDKPLFIEFYKDGCSPCRAMSPIVDELAQERDDIIVGKINVESEPELAAAFGVRGVPTTVVLINGKVVNQSTGLRRKTESRAFRWLQIAKNKQKHMLLLTFIPNKPCIRLIYRFGYIPRASPCF